MSDMLEQAIIDAKALREAALKNAEGTILERYADEIRDVVGELLEEKSALPPIPGLEEEEPDGAPEEMIGDFADNIPLASTEGEQTCQCPDKDEVIEINFDELSQKIGEYETEIGDMEDRSDFIDDMEGEEGLPVEPLDNRELKTPTGPDPVPEIDSADREEDEERFPIRETLERFLKEEYEGKLTGKEKENKLLKEQKEQLTSKVVRLTEEREKVVSSFMQLKETATKMVSQLKLTNTMNAKLVYQNKALTDNSLNERQKKTFVEALNRAKSEQEAKTIYETLQSAAENSSHGPKIPESLDEAVDRRRSLIFRTSRKVDEEETVSPQTARWQKMAGIK